jgi:hypothetical protein
MVPVKGETLQVVSSTMTGLVRGRRIRFPQGKFIVGSQRRAAASSRLPVASKGEKNCTGEIEVGQFSIFGAVEENVGHGSSRMGTDQEHFQGMAPSRAEGVGSVCCGVPGEKFGVTDRRIVHSWCTGNAERQWSVVGGQWPVERVGGPLRWE